MDWLLEVISNTLPFNTIGSKGIVNHLLHYTRKVYPHHLELSGFLLNGVHNIVKKEVIRMPKNEAKSVAINSDGCSGVYY